MRAGRARGLAMCGDQDDLTPPVAQEVEGLAEVEPLELHVGIGTSARDVCGPGACGYVSTREANCLAEENSNENADEITLQRQWLHLFGQ